MFRPQTFLETLRTWLQRNTGRDTPNHRAVVQLEPLEDRITPASVFINEVDADTPGTDTAEFVELYDGGTGNTSLNGLTLVFFNGSSDTSYAAFDLDGQSTNAQGYFVLGAAGVPNVNLTFPNPDNNIQNGADAVALYQADATDFPNGTAVTTTNLCDAVVYDTDDADDSGLLALLNANQLQVNENVNGNKDNESISRVPDGGTARNTDTYAAQAPTPGATNGTPVHEINVQGLGMDIADGDTSPQAADGTDFGSTVTSSGTVTRTFTIQNTGTGGLGVTGVTVSGANSSDFTVANFTAGTVAPGGTLTFDVIFDPSADGVRNATVNIANDDADENPYDFAVTGTGVASSSPEINVQGLGMDIADGDTSPQAVDGTDFGSVVTSSGTVSRTFTIQNTGTGGLSVTGLTVSGANSSDFTVTNFTAGTVAPSGTLTFDIVFDPSADGVRNAMVNIANDDADEDPYDFAVTGTGIAAPPAILINEVDADTAGSDDMEFIELYDGGAGNTSLTGLVIVLFNGNGEVSYSAFDLDGQSTDANGFFVLGNTGVANVDQVIPANSLQNGADAVALYLGNDSDFPNGTAVTTTNLLDAVVYDTDDADDAGLLTLLNAGQPQLNENANGNKDGESNSRVPDGGTARNTDTYIAQAPTPGATNGVAAPEINVQGLGMDIADGDTAPQTADGTDFGTIATASGSVTRTFTIQNTGNSPLSVTGVTITGANSGDFSIQNFTAGNVAPSGTLMFDVVFDPSADGARNATVNIANDDADENPYDFAITGTGTSAAAPEINVQGQGTDIADGDTSPAIADGTDFRGVLTSGASRTHTFTIQNTGTSALTVTGITLSGANSGDFTVANFTPGAVAASGTVTFDVVFDPSADGVRTATVNIANDDADEATYNFDITGSGHTVIAAQNFDGGEVNLTSGFNPATDNADGGPGDFFGVGNRNAWPQGFPNPGVPFAIADDSVFGYSSGTPNATDDEGIFGQNADLENDYFAISDNDAFAAADKTASWTFDISSATGDLQFAIDVASRIDADFSYDAATDVTFTTQIDGGAVQTLFTFDPVTNSFAVGTFRAMDSGTNEDPQNLLVATGDAAISKSFADGSVSTVSAELYLDKSVVANGSIDTFFTSIAGTGSSLVITANANVPFEGVVFDNLLVTGLTGTPAPEINVQGLGMDVADGDTAPQAADGTDFGSTATTGGTVTRTFTVQNTGTAGLSVTGVTISGANAADFTIQNFTASTVAPSGTLTFDVVFDPGADGVRNATVNIANDDADENPYDFAITGTGVTVTAPEINVQGQGVDIPDGDTSPQAADDTDFGSTFTTSGSVTHTFTVQNTGTADLNVSAINITGANAADFTVQNFTAGAVAPSGNLTFDVVFDPSADGARNATVEITNDDADENPYDFAITGTGTPVPSVLINEVDADQTGTDTGEFVELYDGGAGSTALDGLTIVFFNGSDDASYLAFDLDGQMTNAQGFFVLGNAAVPNVDLVFADNTLQNGADAVALFIGDATDFPNDTAISTTNLLDAIVYDTNDTDDAGLLALLNAGQPQVNEDANGNKDTESLSRVPDGGTARNTDTYFAQAPTPGATNGTPAPEINVQGQGQDIADGDTSPELADDTDFGATATIGGMVTHTFTVQNTGTANLNVSAINITGANAADFTVQNFTAGAVAPSGNFTFDVVFDPSADGARNATVEITNDDADENPYDFAITGTGTTVPAPEINVQGQGQDIADGDTTPEAADGTDFGSTATPGGAVTRTFTVQNTGTANLNVTAINITGANAADFTVQNFTAGAVAPSGNLTFDVVFDPSADGARNATVEISNDDANENPYDFAIIGTGVTPVPEIDVRGNGVSILDGDTSPEVADDTDFGSTATAGGTVTRTFTVQNTGTANLNVTAVNITGANAADFTVQNFTAGAVAPSGNLTFDVVFDPSADGVRNATVEITNDDADENPYDFAITGTGTTVPAPEINVQGQGQDIADGDTTPEAADGTDFGSTATPGGAVTRTFTVQNTGTANLNVSAINITGANAADFTVQNFTAGAVAPSGNFTFDVVFDPSADGARNATVEISNDDANENPYDFAITGTVVTPVPEIDVRGNGISIPDGDTTPAANDGTDFGTVAGGSGAITRTFTIFNTGTGPLDLTGNPDLVQIAGSADFTITQQPTTDPVGPGGTTTFDVTFTPMTNGVQTATITITNDDADENPYTFDVQGVVDATVPTVAITRADPNPTNADSVVFNVVFSEDVFNVSAGDFVLDLTGTATANLPVLVENGGDADASTYAVTVQNVIGVGTLGLDLAANNDIEDVGANAPDLTPTIDEVYTIDTVAPQVVNIDDGDADNVTASGATLTYTITFSEDIDAGTFSATDLTNAGTAGITVGTITETSPGGFDVEVTLTSAGTLQLQVPAEATITDVVGNNVIVPVTDDDILVTDTLSPTLLSIVEDPNGAQTNATRTFTVTFSEDVVGFETGDVLVTGTSGATTATVTGEGSVYTVTVTGMTQTGAITLTIPDDVAVDTSAAPMAGGTETFVFGEFLVTGAGPGGGSHVIVRDLVSGVEKFNFFAYGDFDGGVRVATGDINGDGTLDIITGAGPGGGAHVKIYNGNDLSIIDEFFAYVNGFTGGVYVASGDINGDGIDDVITGAGAGGTPHVRVFGGDGAGTLADFFAYVPGFGGGVTVASADINADGLEDIITGAGPGGGPHVKGIDARFTNFRDGLGVIDDSGLLISFFAYDATFEGGVFVGAGDVNGDGVADIVTGPGEGGTAHIKVVNPAFGGDKLPNGVIADSALLANFFTYVPPFAPPASVPEGTFSGGAHPGVIDFDGDSLGDIVTGPGADASLPVEVRDGEDIGLLDSFFAFADFAGGVFVN